MTGDDTTLSVEALPGRSRPVLCVTTETTIVIVATFRNRDALDLFLEACGGDGVRLVRRDTVIPEEDA